MFGYDKKIIILVGLILWKPMVLSKNILEVQVHGHDGGFFSWFKGVIGYLDYYEKNKQLLCPDGIRFNLTGGFYSDPSKDANWWDYYFEPSTETSELDNITYCKLQLSEFYPYCYKAASNDFTYDRANWLINKYIKIRNHIKYKVELFVAQNFADHFIIGVHYRGTDKCTEAPPVNYVSAMNEIEKSAYNKKCRIFLATDDQKFLDLMKAKWNTNLLYIDMPRSHDGLSLFAHSLNNMSPYQNGESALIDCILLSKCNLLIRTNSNLSSASQDFNPHIPVINLNYSFFPGQLKNIKIERLEQDTCSSKLRLGTHNH